MCANVFGGAHSGDTMCSVVHIVAIQCALLRFDKSRHFLANAWLYKIILLLGVGINGAFSLFFCSCMVRLFHQGVI